jgi:hypothetical protein
MIITLDITRVMLDRIEDYLAMRAIEIDGHVERATVADQGLSLILCAGRKAIRDEKRKKSKISKEPKAPC